MSEEYGNGQHPGDWTSDTVPHGCEYECTECHDKIAPDVWIFQQDKRLLCGDCIVLVLNAREDALRNMKKDAPDTQVKRQTRKSATVQTKASSIAQPSRITEDGHLFFIQGYSGGFAAEYGIRLTRDEYEAQLVEQRGPGKLVETDGVFTFET